MRISVLFIYWIFSTCCLAQNDTIRIFFTDMENTLTFQEVAHSISINSMNEYQFNVNATYSTNFSSISSVRVLVNDPAFSPLDTIFSLNSIQISEGLLQIRIPISFTGQDIEGIEVSGQYKPEVIFGSDELHVEDFEVLSEDEFIILTYSKKINKSSRLIHYKDGEISSEKNIDFPIVSKELIRDYQGKIYLDCETEMFEILLNNISEEIELLVISKDNFNRDISPIKDSLDNQFFISNYQDWYPAFEYYAISTQDSSLRELYKVRDELMMELYRSEYKWMDVRTKLWAWDMERETGIDREIWVGANYFTQSIYYEPLYAPLFLINDTLLIFDFLRDSLFGYHSKNMKLIIQENITFHKEDKKTGWKKWMIQDPITKKVYGLYGKVGYFQLVEVSPRTGEIEKINNLTYRYCEKIKVYDNAIYYVYRPFESPQKKYLYKEKI